MENNQLVYASDEKSYNNDNFHRGPLTDKKVKELGFSFRVENMGGVNIYRL